MTKASKPLRVVLAKVGLDGHDRGVKVVARGLRDAGMHVIYAGLWQTPEAVVRIVQEEDAGWLGLSLLSGAHMTLVPRVLGVLKQAGLEHVRILVGGIIPEADIPRLLAMGVARVFGPGTSLDDIVAFMHGEGESATPDDLLARLDNKDRNALSRLLTLAAQGDDPLQGQPLTKRRGRVVAFTGSGGVGKSTLIGKVLDRLRARSKSVAVLACDPQSPVTGGALLGDRFRMGERLDDGVFIRSLAAPSGAGALASNLPSLIRLFDRFGFEVVLIETVGAGQGDTAIRDIADVLVLLVQPESGDEWQWEKAGVFEVADVIVVHKADLPGAEQTLSDIRAALEHAARPAGVIGASSKTGAGVDELVQRIVGDGAPAVPS